MRPVQFLFACLLACLANAMGGCSQQMAVEGRTDRLCAEAQGALLSEGFRPVSRAAAVPGTQGSDPKSGRLEFLYYADNVSPTVVEIQIGPAAGGSRPAAVQAADAGAADGKTAAAAPSGAHQVVVKAWSSMTFAPDPFIADLAMGVLRRAYMLSGNTP
jgi:hypothetical protein